jgi:HK97 family phage major capsid protein
MTFADSLDAKGTLTKEESAALKGVIGEIRAIQSDIVTAQELEAIKSWSVQTNPTSPPIKLSGGSVASLMSGEETASDAAVKMWYQKKFGEVPAAATQIAKELYGVDNYEKLAIAKFTDFRRFLQYGDMATTPELKRMLVLSPTQILDAAAGGASIKAIKATMIEANDELGGYIAPEEFRSKLIERLPGLTVVRPMANVITTGRDRIAMPKITGGNARYPGAVRVTWVDEVPTGTEAATNATFGQVGLPVYTAMAHTQLSKNLIEDSMFDLAGYLSEQYAIGFAIDEDEQFLVGNGIGRPTGILIGGSVPDPDSTTVSSGSATALLADGIIKIPYGLAAQYRQAGASFVLNKATLQAVRLLKDSTNRYLFTQNENNTAESILKEISGFSVKESEAMPDVAGNTFPIIFGDFKGYTIADRVGLGIERYDDSTTAKQNSVVYVARRRLGAIVTEGWRFVVQKVQL